ncbi:MAG: hypothetical protein R2693_01535 [Nocardioidaceae bacterium]
MNELEFEDFAQQISDAVESFLVSLQAISREESAGVAVPLLLLEVSQVLLAGARLGAQIDFTPIETYQPDVGPTPTLMTCACAWRPCSMRPTPSVTF